MSLPPELQRLVDEAAVRDVALRYARAIDRVDFELLRTCYHPDAYEDHGVFKGGVEEYIAWLRDVALPRYESSVHHITNQSVDIDGDTAWSESYCLAVHRGRVTGEAPDPVDTTMLLRYVDHLERRDSEWRSAHRVCVFEFGRIDPAPSPMDLTGRVVGRRDRTDPSYARHRAPRACATRGPG